MGWVSTTPYRSEQGGALVTRHGNVTLLDSFIMVLRKEFFNIGTDSLFSFRS